MKDGGPFFPNPPRTIFTDDKVIHEFGNSGVSLRDWFAGEYLSGIAGHPTVIEITEESASIVAKEAYLMADAMLRARKEGA